MLDEREALARLGSVDHEAHADAAEESLAPVFGADQLHACDCGVHRVLLFVEQWCRAEDTTPGGHLSI
jgi:hypothetical protein